MTSRLLVISNPEAYRDPEGDVPAFYQAVARSSRIQGLHLQSQQLLQQPEAPLQVLPLTSSLNHSSFLALGQHQGQRLAPDQVDGVFCRTLKPFPPGHLQRLQTLERSWRFLNRPSSKMRQMQARFLQEVAGPHLPPTLVSRDRGAIADFLAVHGTVVAKQANSTQARGVFRLQRQGDRWILEHAHRPTRIESALEPLLSDLEAESDEPLQFMRFLPRTSQGDKRIVVLAGHVLGAYVRRSASGHWVNNVACDGLCSLDQITDAERAAIAATWPSYLSLGLRILGYDFLQDDQGVWRISEINVGNVGGFHRLQQLGGAPAMDQLLTWIDDFCQSRQEPRIRQAEPRDDAAIAAIYQQAIDQGGITMDDRDYGPAAVAAKRQQLQERECLLVVTLRDEVVGWAELRRYSDRAGYQVCAESSVYVHRSERGNGIGHQLQQHLMAEAKRYGYQHLVAKVLAANPDSIRFHQRYGYDIVGTQRRIGLLRGSWHDVTILQYLMA